LVLPFLLETGLLSFKNHYRELDAGYYYIDAIVLLPAFMYLCRIKNPEQLKGINPGEFGKLLGLDRIPEAKCLRKKPKDISNRQKSFQWNMELAGQWPCQGQNEFYYIDGHIQVYFGHQALLGKKHVSRQRSCLPGIQEFWVNNLEGMPYFYVCGQVNEKLQEMITKKIIPLLLDRFHCSPEDTKDPGQPKFTIVFDREAYSPGFFGKLWENHQVAVITYRKNVKDQWDKTVFTSHSLEINGVNTSMELAEKQIELDGAALREIRRLTKNDHQTSILATHPKLSANQVATYMFSRWPQENFFRYTGQDYDFDKIAQYSVCEIDNEFIVVNPAHNKLNCQLKKNREKIARRKARPYTLIEENVRTDLDQTPKQIQEQAKIKQELTLLEQEEQQLIAQRKQTPHRIKVRDMGDNRYNTLHMESKFFRNIIKMICYRAETSFAAMLSADYKKAFNEKRALAKNMINTMGDLKVDLEKKTLEVVLYTQSTPKDNKALENLCPKLNQTKTKFPGTDLTLIYKIASP